MSINSTKATRDELRQLNDNGLEIDVDDLFVLEDGTLRYKNRRVLLYIRDISAYGGRYSDPRFHLSNYSTLVQMKANRRFGKYVVALCCTGGHGKAASPSATSMAEQLSLS